MSIESKMDWVVLFQTNTRVSLHQQGPWKFHQIFLMMDLTQEFHQILFRTQIILT